MKKLLVITTIVGSLLASLASAKNAGNYVGVDLLNTRSDFDTHSVADVGIGVNYKRVIDLDTFFIAPGVFFNNNANENSDATAELEYSYGVKLDIGYDVNDKVAAFVTIGHSENRTDIITEKSTEEAFIVGVGFDYALDERLNLGLAYELSEYGKTRDALDTTDDYSAGSQYEVVRLGLSYNF